MSRLDEAMEAWRQGIGAAAKPSERSFETSTGAPVADLYLPETSEPDTYQKQVGFPGAYPFTRGIQPTMYRGRLWTMRQYAGFTSAKETNERLRYLMEHGQTGLSIAFDLPTQMGYDSDDPLAEGEVGKVGVPINTLDDMDALLDQIPLDQVSISMTINATAPILLAFTVALARRRGIEASALRGTLQNDILKEFIARGLFRYPIAPSMRLATDVMAYCAEQMPRWNSISISGYHIREAGSDAAQEIGFTLANGIAYIAAARDRGLDLETLGKRVSFFFNAHTNFFEEVAKYRAARRLWARIMKERFGVKNERAMMLRFHTQTGGSTLTAQQPDTNVVRVALQALSAVLGGTQSLHTNSRDEALGLPTQASATLALRTQQVIAHESGVTDTIDPLGGAPFIEHLTDDLEQRALVYIEKVDALGGAETAIEQGYIKGEINRTSYEYQKRVESGEVKQVGVNCYTEEEPATPEIFRTDATIGEQRAKSLASLRKKRDHRKVAQLIGALKEAATSDTNLIEPIIDCVENQTTLGEIAGALAETFGEESGRDFY